MSNLKSIPINFNLTPAASSSDGIDLRDPDQEDDDGQNTHKLVPLKNATIANKGSTDIWVKFNARKGRRFIPAGTIFTFEDDQLFSFEVENTSATTAANVFITLDNEPTTKSLLQAVAEKLGAVKASIDRLGQ